MDGRVVDNPSMPYASWAVRYAAAIALCAAFWFVGHSFIESQTILQESSVSANRVENRFAARAKATNLGSAIGYFLAAGTGVFCAALSRHRQLHWRHPLIVLGALYLAWCGMSILWSAEPPLTVRKLAILGLLYVSAFGAAAYFELEDIVWITVLTMGGFVLLGFAAEVACGTLRPWRSDYRFAGTCHPNDQGLQCALLALAACFLTWRERHRPWLQAMLVGAGLIGMAMTKSRTTLAAAVAAMALALVLRFRGVQRWLVLCGGAASLCIAGIAMTFGSAAAMDRAADVAAMGRRENIGSLSGRLPLWKEAWRDAQTRLLSGHGYGAFWGERNVLRYSKRFAWHIPHAHSAYLDHVLATGLIGGLIYLLWITTAATTAVRRAEYSRRPAELFVACIIVFSLVHGLCESKLPGSGLAGFILISAMASIALHAPRVAAAEAPRRAPQIASTQLFGHLPVRPGRFPARGARQELA